ncbi:MAG: hypothetical protein JWN70_6875 [Planctomycetaceae bacterium]|nr:hypothetical protein [Planctomycetaceae bacterium]
MRTDQISRGALAHRFFVVRWALLPVSFDLMLRFGLSEECRGLPRRRARVPILQATAIFRH